MSASYAATQAVGKSRSGASAAAPTHCFVPCGRQQEASARHASASGYRKDAVATRQTMTYKMIIAASAVLPLFLGRRRQ